MVSNKASRGSDLWFRHYTRPRQHDRYYACGTVAWVKTGDLTNGDLSVTDEKITQAALDDCSCKVYPPGTVLIAMYGGFKQIGRTGLLRVPAAINQALTAVEVDHDRLDPSFLLNWLNLRIGEWRRFAGSSRKDPNITKNDIQQFYVPTPSIEIQHSVSATLTLWTRAVLSTERLLKLKRRLKRGLMQQLLSGRRRFPEFAAQPWREVRLRDVAVPCSVRNRGTLGREMVKAVTKASGMIPMKSETIAGSIDRYQIVKRDWFAYNPMRLNIGSISRWRSAGDVLVSPDYVVFRCKDGELDPEFLDQFRRSHVWTSFMNACGNGSVRVRIWFDDLGVLKMRLPPLAEQKKITAVLNTADREIALLELQLAALVEQKKGADAEAADWSRTFTSGGQHDR